MSRIHDALKQAGQDLEGGLDSPRSAPVATPEPDIGRVEERGAAIKVPVSTLPFAGGMSLENWIAGCPESAWKPNPHSVLFTSRGPRQLGMEEFRTLRTRLTQMREKLPLQTILVTSALPGEGKTFISVNLALAFAQNQGRRVLLIDGDLRLSRLHVVLGAERSPGLAEFLEGKAEVSSVLRRGGPGEIFFIAGGAGASNPIELLANGRLKTLLHRLRPLFDWIVIDSPPSVPLSDASLLADLSDGVLMVVRAGKSPFDMAQKGGRQFRDKRLLGVVLNQVPPQAAYSAYYYHAAAETVRTRS